MLSIVATPIGNPKDITLHALEILKSADVIVLEEPKEGIRQLKSLGIDIPKIEKLNEHTDAKDLEYLAELCANKKVALMSDCGTPSFADPGSQLVDICRKKNIPVKTLPGASSLMGILSLSSERIDQFHFRGFLPRDTAERSSQLKKLLETAEVSIVLETPYRCKKLLDELRTTAGDTKILVACNLTGEKEWIWEGKGSDIPKSAPEEAEIIVLFYAKQLHRQQERHAKPRYSPQSSPRRRQK